MGLISPLLVDSSATPATMNRLSQINTARKFGIVTPVRAYRAAKAAGIPFWAMCAFLEQESYGGRNVFGHDGGSRGWASGWGEVTKEKYLRYKAGRKAGKGMQGVGPMQLTWYEFQDEADAAGGCWKIYVNLLVGARILKRHLDASKQYRSTEIGRWRYVAYKYNGKQSYVDSIAPKFDRWRDRLA